MIHFTFPPIAAILVGGKGTRLRPIVADRPKSLALINGRPFIYFLLDQLIACGIKSIILCSGYKGAMLEDELGERYGHASLRYSHEQYPLGTAGALRYAVEFFESNDILVMNGDSYCAADLSAFAEFHTRSDSSASLLLAKVPNIARYGAVELSSDGPILDFCEKGQRSGSGLINAGIYILKKEIIENLPQDHPCSLETDVFPSLIGRGLFGWPEDGAFIDIGIPEDFERAQVFFANMGDEDLSIIDR